VEDTVIEKDLEKHSVSNPVFIIFFKNDAVLAYKVCCFTCSTLLFVQYSYQWDKVGCVIPRTVKDDEYDRTRFRLKVHLIEMTQCTNGAALPSRSCEDTTSLETV
jgi:hypothetical protein